MATRLVGGPIEIDTCCRQRPPPLDHARPRLLRRSGRPADHQGKRNLGMDLPYRTGGAREPPLDLQDLLGQIVRLPAYPRSGQLRGEGGGGRVRCRLHGGSHGSEEHRLPARPEEQSGLNVSRASTGNRKANRDVDPNRRRGGHHLGQSFDRRQMKYLEVRNRRARRRSNRSGTRRSQPRPQSACQRGTATLAPGFRRWLARVRVPANRPISLWPPPGWLCGCAWRARPPAHFPRRLLTVCGARTSRARLAAPLALVPLVAAGRAGPAAWRRQRVIFDHDVITQHAFERSQGRTLGPRFGEHHRREQFFAARAHQGNTAAAFARGHDKFRCHSQLLESGEASRYQNRHNEDRLCGHSLRQPSKSNLFAKLYTVTGSSDPVQTISAVTLLTCRHGQGSRLLRGDGLPFAVRGQVGGLHQLSGRCRLPQPPARSGPGPDRRRVWGRVVFWVADVDAMYRLARTAGFDVQTAPADAPWGERYFHVRDPDGHELSFARPLAPG